MRFLSLPSLLVAALAGLVASIPFSPLAKDQTDLFNLELTLATTSPGRLQAYYDSGAGFGEQQAAQTSLDPGPAPVTYRLPLASGTYRAIRVDPLDRPGTVVIHGVRIVNRGGRVAQAIALGSLRPEHQIASTIEREGRLEVTTVPGADDPQLVVRFDPSLTVASTRHEVREALLVVGGGILAALALLLWLLDRSAGWWHPRVAAARRWLADRPRRAVMILAATAVVLASYPVVFLDRSFVSPNAGTTLLYDTYPTLPGYRSTEMHDPRGSDVGAVMWQHLEYAVVQRRALDQGEWPLWNRYNSAGTPLLGQGQSMFGDPVHGLVLLFRGAAWAWDLKYLLAKWLLAVGLGWSVLLLTRRLSAALLVALAAPFIGFFVFRVNHPAFFSLCYAPWILYAWLRAVRAETWGAVGAGAAALFAGNWSVMHSGTAKEAYMLLLTLNFAGACTLLAAGTGRRQRGTWLFLLATGVAFAFVAYPWWGTFLHTLGGAFTSYNAVSAYQLQPSLALGLFDEILYRPMTPMEWVFNPSLNFLLLGGVLYFLVTLRQQAADRTRLALLLAAAVPAALAFGVVPPTWIVRIPFLGNVAHLDNSFSCVLIILGSILAGAGFAAAADRLRGPEGRGDLALAALIFLLLAGAWIAFGHASHRPMYSTGATFTVNAPGQTLRVSPFVWGSLASLGLALAAFAWACRRALRRGHFTAPLGLLAGLAAAVMLWRHGLHARAVGFDGYVVHPAVRTDFHARSPAVERVRAAVRQEPARGLGLRGNFFSGWVGVYGLEGIYGADALMNPFYRELTGQLPGVERAWDWRLYVEPANVALARPFLDALNVRHYLDLYSDQGLLGKSLRLRETGDLDLYESTTAWPRAFFTDRLLRYAGAADFVAAIRGGDGRPFAALQRPDEAGIPGIGAVSGRLEGRQVRPATQYRLTENTTSFRVQSTGPGVVVLNEVLWPGDFRAEVDGRRVPVLRLNHAFKGVLIGEAGEHQVTFRYVPRGFPRSLQVAGLGLVIMAGLMTFAWRSRRQPLRA